MLNISFVVIKKSFIAAVVAVLINIIASFIVLPFASSEQIYPPSGVENLDHYSQIVHLLLLDNRVIISNSILVSIIVFISVILALGYSNASQMKA
tara:strand:+ start:812 stop:1096 length:285 start_codon:yes stop_codon:yes gene_type:complete